MNSNEGSTPVLSDEQARRLLQVPPEDTVKGARDRAILATLLYHGIRREELCVLAVKDIQSRKGVKHFKVMGKRDKIRYVPLHPLAQRLIENYLGLAGHGNDSMGLCSAGAKQPDGRAGAAAQYEVDLSQCGEKIRTGNGPEHRG